MRGNTAVLNLLTAALLAGCPRPQVREVYITPKPTPVPTPTPAISIPYKRMETARLFNGMKVNATLDAEPGTTANAERSTPGSYTLELAVKVKVPKAHSSLAELTALNPELPKLLPGLEAMIPTAKVDDFFDDMYRRKISTINRDLVRLDQLISRHNFYDCETILNLQHPGTKRRAVLIQADMDVVMDGSDSDRVRDTNGASANFQPTTSYRWPKKTTQPNPFLAGREERLKQAEQEIAASGTSAKAQQAKADLPRLRAELDDLKKNSFLIAAADPFIVLPGPLLAGRGEWAPKIGDYCAVIFGTTIYPAIVGDAGPTYKVGEASLRLCKQLNPAATALNRPVSDLKVTYLVFPGSGERPWGPPDLEKWRAKCDAMLKELGGYEGELFAWEDVTKPKPTPSPAPSASPSATAAPSATP